MFSAYLFYLQPKHLELEIALANIYALEIEIYKLRIYIYIYENNDSTPVKIRLQHSLYYPYCVLLKSLKAHKLIVGQ